MGSGVNGRPASAEAILEGLADGVFEIDSRWRLTYVNPGAARVFGRPLEELIGREIWEVFPELAATPFGAVYRKAMAERSSERVEGEYAPLGAWFEARVFPAAERGLVGPVAGQAISQREQPAGEDLLAPALAVAARHRSEGVDERAAHPRLHLERRAAP